ncbi:MAG: tetratricopeptide repeat protein, partial [Dongiaceae bacterium]
LSAATPTPPSAADDKFGGNSGSASLLSALDSKAAAATATAATAAAASATTVAATSDSSTDAAPAPAADPVAPTTAEAIAPSQQQQQPRGLTFPPPPSAGETSDGNSSAPAPADVAAVQQAAVTPTPRPASGNWLLGQWEGPSLGCPPGGGFEFTSNQTRSYYQGTVTVALPATYELKGDRIVVRNPGTDGSYTYRQSSPDTVTIETAPPVMPPSIIGVKYQRCGAAPTAAATQSALVPASAPIPPVDPRPASAAPKATTDSASTASDAQRVATTSSGWDAFERGDYPGALAIWKPQALKGDRNLQVLVGSMYDYGQGVPADKKEALKWYLMAAQRGSGRGQFAAANLLSRGDAGPRNLVEAYKWLTLANQSLVDQAGQVTPVQALELRDQIARQMSQADIDKAQNLVSSFKGQG